MHFTVEAQKYAERFLTAGSIAIDATCGNGFDTLFLAERVGSTGVVYGVDIQVQAIDIVRTKLIDAGHLAQCRLIAGSHASLRQMINVEHHGKVSVAMFNLGYLPFGDKNIVTQQQSTLAGLNQSLELIRPSGLISVLAYPGHAGGPEEVQSVSDWVELHAMDLDIERFQDSKNQNSPILWLLRRLT